MDSTTGKKDCKILRLDDVIRKLPEKMIPEESKELDKVSTTKAVVITFHHIPQAAMPTLYYRESPANYGLVFAKPERAKHITRVHHALGSSKTWGEFKMKLPEEEYTIISIKFDFDEDQWPKSSTLFNSEEVPGYCDGDYPAWLQQEMDSCLPEEILDKYAKNLETTLNGNYYHIEENDEEAICRDLRALGFQVIKREDLYFY